MFMHITWFSTFSLHNFNWVVYRMGTVRVRCGILYKIYNGQKLYLAIESWFNLHLIKKVATIRVLLHWKGNRYDINLLFQNALELSQNTSFSLCWLCAKSNVVLNKISVTWFTPITFSNNHPFFKNQVQLNLVSVWTRHIITTANVCQSFNVVQIWAPTNSWFHSIRSL